MPLNTMVMRAIFGDVFVAIVTRGRALRIAAEQTHAYDVRVSLPAPEPGRFLQLGPPLLDNRGDLNGYRPPRHVSAVAERII